MLQLTTDYQKLEVKYNGLVSEYDYMKVSYAGANEKKDEMISSQKKTIENYNEM